MSQSTRSKLIIDAVATGAAALAPGAVNPVGKLKAIAGLAGFVLWLFRSKEPLSPVAGRPSGQRPASVRPAFGKEGRRAQAGKGGRGHG